MKITILGAGAIGGYFGARLLEAGRDITFLVRKGRAAALRERGLIVKSSLGDVHVAKPPVVIAGEIKASADLVILSCKAYDLDGALDAIQPTIGPQTMILPLLNGMAHLDLIAARFGDASVLGGQCVIAATLAENGDILHLNDTHILTFGERRGGFSPRVERVAEAMKDAGFQARVSDAIILEMWEKWVFLASLAGGTCLMRASVGDIMASPGGQDFMMGLLGECSDTATAFGNAPRAETAARMQGMVTAAGSPITASMLRDILRGNPIEADHVIGDLIRRAGEAGQAVPLLDTAYLHLKAYEHQRNRQAAKPQ